MSEAAIILAFRCSRQNKEARCEAVNALRHTIMDKIVFDSRDEAAYEAVYERVMGYISRRYPPLSDEVERQMAKKRRRKGRGSEERKERLHTGT